MRLAPWWERHERAWVTFDKIDARSQLSDEQTWWAHHPTTRNLPNALRNLGLAIRVLWTYGPDVVVSNGAGVAVPFFVIARLMRRRTVYLEVFDRVKSPTLTGRLCRPLTHLFCVQWPQQQAWYRGSVVVGPLL